MSHKPDRSHEPNRGQYHRKPTGELTELGQFLETMFPGLSRRQQGEALGVREDVYSDMVLGGRTPTQRWVKSLNWEAVLAQSPEWQKDPAANTTKFKEIIGKLPLQSPYEIEPAKPNTLGEVFELAFPGYDRLEQAMALGVLETKNEDAARHFMRQIATHDFKASQQLMANYGFRLTLERHCLQHGGAALWQDVRDKFDAIAGERVITAITGGSKSVVQAWSGAVGEVFAKARKLSGHSEEIFASAFYEDASNLMHIEKGGWFTQGNQFHNPNSPFREKDHIRTRAIYLRIAEKIYGEQAATQALAGSGQVKLMAALETLFPEIATASHGKQRPGLVPAP